MKAKIRDTEIFFDVEGAGLVPDGSRMKEKPVLFAVHGGPGVDHTGYKPALSPLSDLVQIVYFDHRGQGRSARGEQNTYTLQNNVEDMEALRQHLGLDKIIVLGGSYGGIVAQAYTAKYPHNVSHLIAVVTASEGTCLERAKEILQERGTPEQIACCQALWDGNFKDDEELRTYFDLMGSMYSTKYNAEAARTKRERSILSHQAINEAFGGFLRTLSLTDSLKNITCPTLVIGAGQDWICPPEFSQLIAETIPQAVLKIFENSGHWVAADEHEGYIETIRAFIEAN